MAWSPVNDNVLKGKLESKISEIAEVLIKIPIKDIESISLMSGKTGIALFLYYYGRLVNEEIYFDHATELISDVFEQINDGRTYFSFAGGLSGIAWAVNHLSQKGFVDIDEKDPFEEIDEFLSSMMMLEIRKGNFDYLHGAIGVGLYFLSVLNDRRKSYLRKLIDELDLISYKDENGGICWISSMIHDNDRKACNLGLSHGLASIIRFLGKAYKNGISEDRSLLLLNGAVEFLLNSRQDPYACLSFFPNWVLDDHTPQSSRLAWCYGDLGIAASLYSAAGDVASNEWTETAIRILKHSASRSDIQNNGIKDAGLCHGTAGVAHIFNRLYNNTHVIEFQKAAEYWFEESLKMAKFFDGLAGYQCYISDTNTNYINQAGFLEGIAGIGLALLGAVSCTEPDWDHALLLS